MDLNPVRAGLVETPETSDYTSIQERVGGLPEEVESEAGSQETTTAEDPAATLDGERLRPEAETRVLSQAPLMPFDATAQTPWAVPFAFEDYLELVDWTGRALRADKRGYIWTSMGSSLSAIPNVFSRRSERQLVRQPCSGISAPGVRLSICVASGLRERYL